MVLADDPVEHLHGWVHQLAHRLRGGDGARVRAVHRGHQLLAEVGAAEPVGLEGVDPGKLELVETRAVLAQQGQRHLAQGRDPVPFPAHDGQVEGGEPGVRLHVPLRAGGLEYPILVRNAALNSRFGRGRGSEHCGADLHRIHPGIPRGEDRRPRVHQAVRLGQHECGAQGIAQSGGARLQPVDQLLCVVLEHGEALFCVPRGKGMAGNACDHLCLWSGNRPVRRG